MASTKEGLVKKKVKALLDRLGAYHFSPMGTGYGHAGVPDIVGCYRGLFFCIECKTIGNKPTALQSKELEKIAVQGGIAFVVNEDTLDRVVPTLILRSVK